MADYSKPWGPQWPRTEQGWVDMPRDDTLRRQFFPPEVMIHPARANLHMMNAILDYAEVEPGQVVMDVMAGSGSIMVASLRGCHVVCLELKKEFHPLLYASRQKFIDEGYAGGNILIREGDCRDLLPIPVDHIIFSPPYGSVLKFTKDLNETTGQAALGQTYLKGVVAYTNDPRDLGQFNDFFYKKAMARVYQLCYESLSPGGTLTFMLKDRINGGVRVEFTRWAVDDCEKAGFKVVGWAKRFSRGTGFKNERRSKGFTVVDDEDIVTLVRP